MSNSTNNLGNMIASFLGLGIFIALLICALVFFSYVFVIGAVIGLILFIVSYIRAKLTKNKPQHVRDDGKRHRTIDQD